VPGYDGVDPVDFDRLVQRPRSSLLLLGSIAFVGGLPLHFGESCVSFFP
jgi:hypothetical protein